MKKRVQEKLAKAVGAKDQKAAKQTTAKEAPSKPAEAPKAPAKGNPKAAEKASPNVTEETRKALLKVARDAGVKVEETTGFYKMSGKAPGLRVYVSKKGNRIDLSGFSVKHPAVEQVSEEEAKARHIGKVRGILDMTKAAAEAAFGDALRHLGA